MDQKLEFAERLRAAMLAAGLEARPGVLLNLFNTHYWGRSVTFQAVSRWLRGEAIPAQDKLITLADLLKIEPEVLRFGEVVRKSVRVRRQRWDEGVGYLERETFDAFLQLPAPQRKLIREVILTFAKVHQGGAAPRDASAGKASSD
ncbi:MAG TPA: transcriptional regulator [Comamonadaceae bacterium]|jgi:transcriptional regulator with XRE-family HTH domain|nr:helix-turn-helix domain-containing protein [Burkholderiaceae bacterium]OGB45427.1 MAG: transcriptional regulator [Burkholderiales bacterium RIFCSPLOWO2_12_FULL_65_40]HCE30053.1 transcriptional regulator [Comamonadaceae bacterium]